MMASDTPILSSGAREAAAGPSIFPSHPMEHINALAHYYRGEMSRMISWRDRIDRTTNWAIASVAAMLSVTLSNPGVHHSILLFAMAVVGLLLGIETRRYRFFHVYRSRVRLIERNYYAQIFHPSTMRDPSVWLRELADDLRTPRFNMTFAQAVARRLRRTYFWIFAILLAAWLLKGAVVAPGGRDWARAYAIGWVPGSLVMTLVCALFAVMGYVMVAHRERPGELAFGDVHM